MNANFCEFPTLADERASNGPENYQCYWINSITYAVQLRVVQLHQPLRLFSQLREERRQERPGMVVSMSDPRKEVRRVHDVPA